MNAQLRSAIIEDAPRVTVACLDGKLVAFLATGWEPSVTWINQLYVAPTHIGQGIGSLLLTGALRTLSGPVRLYTFQANSRARSFYERHGFKAVAFGDGSDNEERCPDVLCALARPTRPGTLESR